MGKKFRNREISHKTLPDGSEEAVFVKEEYEEADPAPAAPAAPVTPVAEEPAPAPEVHLVDFDGWYGARASRIPAHHHKEILRADFKGRKVPVMASMADFDEALKKYGVRLA